MVSTSLQHWDIGISGAHVTADTNYGVLVTDGSFIPPRVSTAHWNLCSQKAGVMLSSLLTRDKSKNWPPFWHNERGCRTSLLAVFRSHLDLDNLLWVSLLNQGWSRWAQRSLPTSAILWSVIFWRSWIQAARLTSAFPSPVLLSADTPLP